MFLTDSVRPFNRLEILPIISPGPPPDPESPPLPLPPVPTNGKLSKNSLIVLATPMRDLAITTRPAVEIPDITSSSEIWSLIQSLRSPSSPNMFIIAPRKLVISPGNAFITVTNTAVIASRIDSGLNPAASSILSLILPKRSLIPLTRLSIPSLMEFFQSLIFSAITSNVKVEYLEFKSVKKSPILAKSSSGAPRSIWNKAAKAFATPTIVFRPISRIENRPLAILPIRLRVSSVGFRFSLSSRNLTDRLYNVSAVIGGNTSTHA